MCVAGLTCTTLPQKHSPLSELQHILLEFRLDWQIHAHIKETICLEWSMLLLISLKLKLNSTTAWNFPSFENSNCSHFRNKPHPPSILWLQCVDLSIHMKQICTQWCIVMNLKIFYFRTSQCFLKYFTITWILYSPCWLTITELKRELRRLHQREVIGPPTVIFQDK